MHGIKKSEGGRKEGRLCPVAKQTSEFTGPTKQTVLQPLTPHPEKETEFSPQLALVTSFLTLATHLPLLGTPKSYSSGTGTLAQFFVPQPPADAPAPRMSVLRVRDDLSSITQNRWGEEVECLHFVTTWLIYTLLVTKSTS